jgi:hypothetical protein
MNRIERVVVDECVGQESPLVGQLRQRLGEQQVKVVFLATEHPGIPDIEILDKLLDVRSALLTQDRGLHNLAIGRGFRSFVHTPESGLTDRRLVHVSAPDKHLPLASGALRDSYQHQSNPEAQAITECLYSFLSAHQLKQFRTKRRRIRAHFGSPDNIGSPSGNGAPRRVWSAVTGYGDPAAHWRRRLDDGLAHVPGPCHRQSRSRQTHAPQQTACAPVGMIYFITSSASASSFASCRVSNGRVSRLIYTIARDVALVHVLR